MYPVSGECAIFATFVRIGANGLKDFPNMAGMDKSDVNVSREKEIYRVTIVGSVVNLLLLAFKFFAGIAGHSAAMLADAVHSLSDFVTDIIVLVFVKLSSKPEDADHDYGHGKYETLATAIIGVCLCLVGLGILWNGAQSIWHVVQGGTLVVANAWHHRSDAFSSVGTMVGIGGAILLGDAWRVLDPVAAVVVSFFIIKVSFKLLVPSMNELLEKSLPAEVEDKVTEIALSFPGVSSPHHLRTRRIGTHYSIDLHVRMDGNISLEEAHHTATAIEQKLRETFGQGTYINIHVEPIK